MIETRVLWKGNTHCGVGYIRAVDPYKDGVLRYRENKHYKVFFPQKMVYITLFEQDLSFE